MSNTDPLPANNSAPAGAERRQYVRRSLNSLSYVQLDETNGGILLNVSEDGIAVHAAMSVMEDMLPHITLQPPRSRRKLHTAARVAWTSKERRLIGIQFENPPDEFCAGLREWFATEAVGNAKALGRVIEMPSETDLNHETSGSAAPRSTLSRSLRALATDWAPVVDQRMPIGEPKIADDSGRAAVRVSSAAAPAAAASSNQQSSQTSPRRYIPIIALLAVLSLFAGWQAGRGDLLSAFLESHAAASGSAVSASQQPAANPVFANFLVIDANNRSWLVPFAGPADVAKVQPSSALPPQTPAARAAIEAASSAATNPQTAYRLGTLYNPQNRSYTRALNPSVSAPAISSGQMSTPVLGTLSPPTPIEPAPTDRVTSILVPATVTHHVNPVYPAQAFSERIEGAVKLQAHVTADGKVSAVKVISGPSQLVSAATNAVRNWEYKPEMLDGKPVASDVDLTIQFKLPQ